MDRIYSFIFRGLLTEVALDKAGRKSKITLSEGEYSKITERLSVEQMDEEIITRARRMAAVYTALTAFEISVREFVLSILTEKFSEDWWKKGVSDKIRKKAESRKKEEEKIRWHTQRGDNLLNYIEFGDLASIININWVLFEPHLNTLEWTKQILDSLEKSRNVIMHSGDLDNHDIERMGTYFRDWIRQVGF